MKDDEALRLAAEAARAWGGLAAPARLINNRENAVFEVQLADGTRAALRLHRAGYQLSAAIEAELRWTDRLADAGFPCPRPIPTADGDLITTDPGRPNASVVSWIDGAPIGAMEDTFDGGDDAQALLYHTLGALLARLHDTTDALALGKPPRPRWDIDGLLGETPLWGRFWENPSLSRAESDRLRAARDDARERLEALASPDFGLIHADVLQENVLAAPDGLTLIDFDDSGWGFRAYDLGTALVQHLENPALPTLRAALIDGYAARARLSEDSVIFFTALRAMASCGWVMPRLPHDDPRQRLYAERALAGIGRDVAAPQTRARVAQTTTSSRSCLPTSKTRL